MINKFDFIGYLRKYCNENHIYGIFGPEDYRNAVADWHVYDPYELILTADFSLSPDFDEESVTYTGNLGLGRKREDKTRSDLSETWEQKYDRRLQTLTEALYMLLKGIQCEEGAELSNCTMSYGINIMDINADFIVANLSIKIY